MKLHPFALLVILSSVGEYFGYCRPLLTLHSSPSSALLSHAFAPLLPHVRKFFISPFFSWYESDRVGLFLHAYPFAGFQLYDFDYKNLSYPYLPTIEHLLTLQWGLEPIFKHTKPDQSNHFTFLEIRRSELDALAFLCNRLVEDLNYLQSTGSLRSLLGPPYLTKGPNKVSWSIDFVHGNQWIGGIHVTIKERKEPEGNMPMEMRIDMLTSNNSFMIKFLSNGLPLIQANDGHFIFPYLSNLFNDIIMRDISEWFAALK